MLIFLQVFFALLIIILVILFVFQPRRKEGFALPENYQELLNDYVRFYFKLDEDGKKRFEDKLKKFSSFVKITGANAEVEDLDRILIGAAAIIPTFYIRDWEYINLREVLVYPGNFNTDFEQHGHERSITGMVGTGAMQNVMIISKWDLRQGFIDSKSHYNTAIHEFVHLIDKMDGTLDGVPEILLERKYVGRWKELLEETMNQIRNGSSDINPYGATSAVECFAVIAEYFFEQPELFRSNHPELSEMLTRIFIRR
ncbi:MAG TPA: M90 family metallopeptidase [Flavisolibacter sp.]|nr:M90 family metallopeptidase [Flavisolibacter sp.]